VEVGVKRVVLCSLLALASCRHGVMNRTEEEGEETARTSLAGSMNGSFDLEPSRCVRQDDGLLCTVLHVIARRKGSRSGMLAELKRDPGSHNWRLVSVTRLLGNVQTGEDIAEEDASKVIAEYARAFGFEEPEQLDRGSTMELCRRNVEYAVCGSAAQFVLVHTVIESDSAHASAYCAHIDQQGAAHLTRSLQPISERYQRECRTPRVDRIR
jgi:hypothetical protein